jgi:flagellar protein FlgJ
MQIRPLPKTAADIDPERLAHNTTLTEDQKIAEASRQFEAILLRQILSATQKPVIQSKYADTSTASQIYQDLVNNQLAQTISKTGAFGLADTFEQQLTRPGAVSLEKSKAPAPGSPQSSAFNSLHPITGAHIKSHRHETEPPRGQQPFSSPT